MAALVRLREDFVGPRLRDLAKRTRDASQLRRLLALAEVYDGRSRGEAARIGGVGLQRVHDWVLRFNARGPDGLIDAKHPGPRPKLNAEQRAALGRLVEDGPQPAIDGVVRWRLKDLVAWIQEEFAICMDETTLGRTLRAMGYRKLSARARHYAQDPEAAAAPKLSRQARSDPQGPAKGHRDINLVAGRGQDRAEEQNHPPLGQAWNTAHRTPRPTHLLGLSLRCHLSGPRGWCRSRPAHLQQRRHEPSSAGNLRQRRPRRPWHRYPRSGRMAPVKNPRGAGQHHASALAAEITRTQPGREHLAVHPRQLALESSLHVLSRYPRPLLLRLEQPHQTALDHYVDRATKMGPSVISRAGWY